MKNLIIEVLDDLYDKSCKRANKTKTIEKQINIDGVSVSNILKILVDNQVSTNAHFSSDEDGKPVICWEEKVPTTEEEKEKMIEKHFIFSSYNSLFKKLVVEHNYRRLCQKYSDLKEFENINVYKMYIEKDFDRLVNYYSKFFNK